MSEQPAWRALAELPRAFGGAPLTGRLRAAPEDFQVDELPAFDADGEGDHAMLHIRKTGLNTEDVARKLARLAAARPVDVGYCGLKDRNAVTSQWFTVNLTGREEPDWSALEDQQLSLLTVSRQRRKLKRGTARGNRFRLRVSDLDGDRDSAERCLQSIRERGVPNYFGEQRFGRNYGNLYQAGRLFAGQARKVRPHLRGLYLSAARSQLFNELLAARVGDGTWERPLAGDLMALEGSRSWFAADEIDQALRQRMQQMDIHPSGPLWGRGGLPSSGRVAAMEASLAQRFADWCEGLERMGMKQERRALRMRVVGLAWEWSDADLTLEFSLASGCYATAVMREVLREPAADPCPSADAADR